MATEVLERDECLRLLASQTVGRLAVMVGGYPQVTPVNFALDDDMVVFRSGPGAKLSAAVYRNVSFEVDQIDVTNRSGWSVLVTGRAELLGDDRSAELLERAKALHIEPFDAGDKHMWVRIVPNAVTGRRVGPNRTLYFDLPSEAYL
jgi:nitroimidazol reductase NimA-like FMN-containing flavoprotein (pyridoxamine 5'-phosphate oxidase superfamily)